MLGSKLDIFKKEWLDVVFEGRNKSYGAYELRKLAPRATNIGVLVASSFFVVALLAPSISKYLGLSSNEVYVEEFIEHEVVLAEPPPVNEEEPPPPPPQEPPPPKTDMVRMPQMAVVPSEMVQDEEPPTVEALKLADPGSKTIAGDPNADIRIDLPVGEGKIDAQVTETGGSEVIPMEFIEIRPIPAEGSENGFREWIGNNYRYPPAALDAGVKGILEVTFVVERDGSLTDIKVKRDLGFGTAEEAIRLFKTAKKWKPGVQNGRPVRVQYTVPINLSVQN